MDNKNREYLTWRLEANKKSIENEKEQILCYLDSLMEDVERAKKNVQRERFNLDTFCRNAQGDLMDILLKSKEIREILAKDSIMEMALE